MKNINKFLIVISIIVVIAVIVIVFNVILNNSGKVNEGNYRINDIVLRSTVSVKDETSEKVDSLSDISMELSQENLISILIAKNTDNTEINKIYIDNIKTTKPGKVGEFVILQELHETNYDLNKIVEKIDIIPVEKGLQYLVNVKVQNLNFLGNVKIPESINELKYDGTILKTFNISKKDISFKISFDLNIIEKTGKLNKCSIKLELPDEYLIQNGISIQKLKASDFNFVVK